MPIVEINSPYGYNINFDDALDDKEYDIYSIRSMRRNPVIADLFHRLKYMERRGSGLRKIVSETEKLPGYLEIYNTRSLGLLYNRKKQTRNLLVYWLSKSHLFYKKIFESSTGKWPA